ncbi:membrane protein [Paenibacillus sp. UNCCL117]|uniref:YihY/virulence factor BrkB family protein n=1 Tax=unclassified Paenibacillus TaxID=185978 RepID=UPI000881EBDC|nr:MULTISPECIES: YihY/virulence factor BrkB family protein [unclassified Paenibacillus]SDC89603.1 membrane protein [Paenibacillus sp. cl123]SFW28597.1 membrane protein [Paenibacillus sp. UNCCL117]
MKLMDFTQTLICRFQDDDLPALSAQLTYYLILSFFPFLIFAGAVLSFTDFSTSDAIAKLAVLLPDMSNQTIAGVLSEIEGTRSGSLLSFGLIATLWSASNGVNAVIKGINKAYDEEENRPFWLIRLLSILATVGLAVAIVLSFVLLVFGKTIAEWIFRTVHIEVVFSPLWAVLQYAIPIVVLWTLFVLVYAYLPNLRLKFKGVIPGAIFATIGWIVVSILFSFYVNQFDSYTKTYGSLGGIIVLLVWLYLSSMIILLGGEINATLHFFKTGQTKPPCKSFALSLPFFKNRNKKTDVKT